VPGGAFGDELSFWKGIPGNAMSALGLGSGPTAFVKPTINNKVEEDSIMKEIEEDEAMDTDPSDASFWATRK